VWLEKLSNGVVKLVTPVGARYLRPATFWQRLYLFWVFRHFANLPQVVLSRRTQNLIRELCAQQSSYSDCLPQDAPLLGTVERLGQPLVGDVAAQEKGPVAAAAFSRRT